LPPVKEWICSTCGFFDSPYPVCITCGGQSVLRVFKTAPGFIGDKTKLTDKNLQVLSHQFGVSDYTNNTSQKHAPNNTEIWQKFDAKKDLAELSAIHSQGVDIKAMKPNLGGTYEAVGHKDDLKEGPK
jgi:hypothetical protein